MSVAAAHGGSPRQRHVAVSISAQHSDATDWLDSISPLCGPNHEGTTVNITSAAS